MPCLTTRTRRHSVQPPRAPPCFSPTCPVPVLASSGGMSNSMMKSSPSPSSLLLFDGQQCTKKRRIRRSKSTSCSLNWMDQIAWNQHSKSASSHSPSTSEDYERTHKSSRFRALFRMINSRNDSASLRDTNGVISDGDLTERLHDLEESLEIEIAARQEAEVANDHLLFELQRSRAEIRDLQILIERLRADDEMATSAPTPTPAPSSPRKRSISGEAVLLPSALPRFSLMDSSMLSSAHEASQTSSRPHTLRRGRTAHATLLANSSNDRVSQPPSLRRTQTGHNTRVSPVIRGARGSQPPSLRRGGVGQPPSSLRRDQQQQPPLSLRRDQVGAGGVGARVSPRSVHGIPGSSQPPSLRRGAAGSHSHVSPSSMYGSALSCSPMGQLPAPLLRGAASGSRSLLERHRKSSWIRSPASNPVASPPNVFCTGGGGGMTNMALSPALAVGGGSQSRRSTDGDKQSISLERQKRCIRKPSSLTRLLAQDDSSGSGSAAKRPRAATAPTNSPPLPPSSSSSDRAHASTPATRMPTPDSATKSSAAASSSHSSSKESSPSSSVASTSATSTTRRSAAESRSFRQMTRGLKMPCKPKSYEQHKRLKLADLLPPDAVPRASSGSHSHSHSSTSTSTSSSSTSSSSVASTSSSSNPTASTSTSSSTSSSGNNSSYDFTKKYMSHHHKNGASVGGPAPAQVLSPISTAAASASAMKKSSSSHFQSMHDQVMKSASNSSSSSSREESSTSLAVSSSSSSSQGHKTDAHKAASEMLRIASINAKSPSAWPSSESRRSSIGNALMTSVKPVASSAAAATSSSMSTSPASSSSPTAAGDDNTAAAAAASSSNRAARASISPLKQRKRRTLTKHVKSVLPSASSSASSQTGSSSSKKQHADYLEEKEAKFNLRSPRATTRTSQEAIDALVSARSSSNKSTPSPSPSPSPRTTPQGTLKKQGSCGPSMKHSRRSLPSALGQHQRSSSSRSISKPRSSLGAKKVKIPLVRQQNSRISAPSSRRTSRENILRPVTPDRHVKSPSPSKVPVPRRTPRGSVVLSPPPSSSDTSSSSPAAAAVVEGAARKSRSKRANELLRRLKQSSTAPAPIPEKVDANSNSSPLSRTPVRPPRPELRRPKSTGADKDKQGRQLRKPNSFRDKKNRRKSSALTSGVLAARSKLASASDPKTPSPRKRSSLKGIGGNGSGSGIKAPTTLAATLKKSGVTPPSSVARSVQQQKKRPSSAAPGGGGGKGVQRSGARSACSSRRSSGVGRGNLKLTRSPPFAAPEDDEDLTNDDVQASTTPEFKKPLSPLRKGGGAAVLRPSSSVRSGLRAPQTKLKK